MRHETQKKLNTFGFKTPEEFEARKEELRSSVSDGFIISLLQKEILDQKEFSYVREHFEKEWDVSLESKKITDPYVSAHINQRKTISVRINKAHIENESNKDILKSLIIGLVEPLENSYMSHVLRITPAAKSLGKFAGKSDDQLQNLDSKTMAANQDRTKDDGEGETKQKKRGPKPR